MILTLAIVSGGRKELKLTLQTLAVGEGKEEYFFL